MTVDPRRVAQAAPEVNQGQWRERSVTPRAVIAHNELVEAMQHALEATKKPNAELEIVRAAMLSAWFPVLRQILEQAGGDGFDVYVREALKPTGAKATAPLVDELRTQGGRIASATTLEAFHTEANLLMHAIRRVLSDPNRTRLSFAALEKELEGRLEISDFLDIFFQNTPKLERRSKELESLVETFRQQLRAMPGKQPGGIYWNFARFKAEKVLVDAELKRRAT